MNVYKFVYYKANSNELINFAKNNYKVINSIIKSCFNTNFRDNYNWLTEDNLFILSDPDNDEIIAVAQAGEKSVVKYDIEIEKYNLITGDQDNNNKVRVTISPLIRSLCRISNPKYKGTGKYLLNKIIKYYKEEEKKNKIYVIPESNKYKVYGENDCGVELDKENYLKSQKKLQEYYNNFGFYELPDHYEVDNCGNLSTGPFVIYPVFCKDI